MLLLTTIVGCDKDEFANINTNPSVLSEPDLRYSLTKAIEQTYNNDYTIWFYDNFDYLFPWSQLTATGLGNGEKLGDMGPAGGHYIYSSLFPNVRDIRYRIDKMADTEKQARQALKGITYPIVIQAAMTVTDKYGSMIYSEAAMAPYTSPALLTPKYDTQEELFTIWLKELDEAITGLTATNQFDVGAQDVIYGGNYQKWAKYCNLLKLKIAARLVNKDKAKALKIAEEVANSSVGYLDNLDDDFLYRRDIKYYGTGNETQPGAAAKNVVDFLVKNKDPRVRFIYTKNNFNAEIVQAFIDAGKELPPYVKQYVNIDASNKFSGWKEPGEPWVRYFGVPLSPDAQLSAEYDAYFKQSELNKISVGDVEKTYRSTSNYSEFITRTNMNYTYPTKPGGRVVEIKDNYPAVKVILGSAAEANLYLAEFKLLGANLPKSAQDYFTKGVRLSVERMDALAKNNREPYYNSDPVYIDKAMAEKGSTKLKAGEIDALLAQSDYELSSDGLEKVYIQQYINFAVISGGDIWTLVRRSGIPKTGSSYLKRDAFLAGGSELVIPRRFEIGTPTADNKNYENQKKAYEEQGFTTGTSDPSILNSQRIWFDIPSPNYGQGPK